MKVHFLGTGNALVTKIYNTCYCIEANGEYLLVDAGGGNQILSQLEKKKIDLMNIHTAIITHKHIDHFLGMIWVVRLICQKSLKGLYDGKLTIYGHDEVIELLKQTIHSLLNKKQVKAFEEIVECKIVQDHESVNWDNYTLTFLDIKSKKDKQYGYLLSEDNHKLIGCLGDEPYSSHLYEDLKDCEYLMHEAFCLYQDEAKFHAYEKNHSTVKDAAENAEKLNVKNVILYHSEEKTIETRKITYTSEAKKYYKGNVIVPDDLETINI